MLDAKVRRFVFSVIWRTWILGRGGKKFHNLETFTMYYSFSAQKPDACSESAAIEVTELQKLR